MSLIQTILLLASTLIVVFLQCSWQLPRLLFGAQVDLLPALVACAALTGNLTGVILLALCGGLWFDALSFNPLGVSVLPLFVVGVVLHERRHLILRHEPFAQFVIGCGAGAAAPVACVVILLSMGMRPLIGWFSLWQLAVMAAASGVATPLFIRMFGRLGEALTHPEAGPISADPTRELKRGRL